MAKSDLINSISVLSKKIDALLEEQKILHSQIEELKKENLELRDKQRDDASKIETTLKDVEFLRLSHRLADSPEALVEARKVISKLIRTIDSCIRLLKED